MAKKTAPARMTLSEAAEYLSMTTDDLMMTRWKGIAPGNVGYKEGGVLYFNKADLPKPKPVKAADDD